MPNMFSPNKQKKHVVWPPNHTGRSGIGPRVSGKDFNDYSFNGLQDINGQCYGFMDNSYSRIFFSDIC